MSLIPEDIVNPNYHDQPDQTYQEEEESEDYSN